MQRKFNGELRTATVLYEDDERVLYNCVWFALNPDGTKYTVQRNYLSMSREGFDQRWRS